MKCLYALSLVPGKDPEASLHKKGWAWGGSTLSGGTGSLT